MMRYEIWSNVSNRDGSTSYRPFLDGYKPGATMTKSFESDVAILSGPDEAALDVLFDLFNRDDRPNAQTAHSLSVGDVVVLGDVAYAVESVGFRRLDAFPPRDQARRGALEETHETR